MSRTVEAVTDEHGVLRLPEAITLPPGQRVLVTILDPGDDPPRVGTVLLSESALSDWNRTEEDEAWAEFQENPPAEP